MCETQSGAAGAADTHTGAATGSLSDMEVRRRSSSSQMVTIQRRPEARHFRLWKMNGPPQGPRYSEPMRHRAPQESQSRQYSPAMTIDADRCPTCSGAQLVVMRGNQVPCPTCTPPTRPGDSERYTFSRRRTARKAKASPARRLTILSLGGAALLVAALALFASDWLRFMK